METNTKNKHRYYIYWLIALFFVAALSFYPVMMGVRVISETARSGFVPVERYPKYVIPYTPLALALIFGTAVMPLMQGLFKRGGFLAGALLSAAVFLAAERLMETRILVQTTGLKTTLESWQMSLCYVPPEMYETRVYQAVDVLLGGYSPWFKLHFYLIAIVILVTLLNSVYGFGRMFATGDTSRKKPLVMQTAASLLFLGMCVWACFTAFYRTGGLDVPPVSAVLMALFFIVMGVSVGLLIGSFTAGRGRGSAVWLPAACASLTALLMYVGELILLSGGLYRFGYGFFFRGLPGISLAPADIAVILASGLVTALLLGRRKASDR